MVSLPAFSRTRVSTAVPVSSRYLRAMWQLQVITFSFQLLTIAAVLWRMR